MFGLGKPCQLELSTDNSESLRDPASQLTLTFLGTGTSQGVPMIGCDCAICRSSDPRDQRLRSSVYIQTPETSFVVDTGTDFRTQALRANIRDVDAVIFTHSHTDHIMGFDDLRRFSYQRGSMPVYASADTMRDLERVFQFAFNAGVPVPYYLKPEPHVVEWPVFAWINPDHALTCAAWRLHCEWLSVRAKRREIGRISQRLQRRSR